MTLPIHELATNAAKYGALSAPAGRIDIERGLGGAGEAQTFRFTWRETGGPAVSAPERQGFGSRLTTRVFTADFGGEVFLDYAANGLVVSLLAPAGNVSGGAGPTLATIRQSPQL